MTFDLEEFERDKKMWIELAAESNNLKEASLNFVNVSDQFRYGYFWSWNGLPIIQMPEDIMLTQEIIWKTKPTVIIETGVAWGGSLAFYAHASFSYGGARIIGIDRTIPEHNRSRILSAPYAENIELWESSSTDLKTYESIQSSLKSNDRTMLILDSNHEHSHVLSELNMWAKLVSSGCYIVVADTVVESLPDQKHRRRAWGIGNNPETALREFLSKNDDFVRDESFGKKTFASFNPNSYVFRV